MAFTPEQINHKIGIRVGRIFQPDRQPRRSDRVSLWTGSDRTTDSNTFITRHPWQARGEAKASRRAIGEWPPLSALDAGDRIAWKGPV